MTTKPVGYSAREQKLLKILRGRKTPVSSDTLCDLFYDGEERPYHAQGSINTAMRLLMRKVEFNREPFSISKSYRRGPHPIEFCLIAKPTPKQRKVVNHDTTI